MKILRTKNNRHIINMQNIVHIMYEKDWSGGRLLYQIVGHSVKGSDYLIYETDVEEEANQKLEEIFEYLKSKED